MRLENLAYVPVNYDRGVEGKFPHAMREFLAGTGCVRDFDARPINARSMKGKATRFERVSYQHATGEVEHGSMFGEPGYVMFREVANRRYERRQHNVVFVRPLGLLEEHGPTIRLETLDTRRQNTSNESDGPSVLASCTLHADGRYWKFGLGLDEQLRLSRVNFSSFYRSETDGKVRFDFVTLGLGYTMLGLGRMFDVSLKPGDNYLKDKRSTDAHVTISQDGSRHVMRIVEPGRRRLLINKSWDLANLWRGRVRYGESVFSGATTVKKEMNQVLVETEGVSWVAPIGLLGERGKKGKLDASRPWQSMEHALLAFDKIVPNFELSLPSITLV